jgi:hypothetical protein
MLRPEALLKQNPGRFGPAWKWLAIALCAVAALAYLQIFAYSYYTKGNGFFRVSKFSGRIEFSNRNTSGWQPLPPVAPSP